MTHIFDSFIKIWWMVKTVTLYLNPKIASVWSTEVFYLAKFWWRPNTFQPLNLGKPNLVFLIGERKFTFRCETNFVPFSQIGYYGKVQIFVKFSHQLTPHFLDLVKRSWKLVFASPKNYVSLKQLNKVIPWFYFHHRLNNLEILYSFENSL